jgi:DNA modification methylase
LDGNTWLRYSISVWNDIVKTKEEQNLNHPAMFPKELSKRIIEMFMTKDQTTSVAFYLLLGKGPA